MDDEDNIVLGGSIELVGFKNIDRSTMLIIKKVVGNYAKRMSEITNKFERLTVTVKSIHKQENNEKYEFHTKLLANGKIYASEFTDKNIFVALDSSLHKLINEIRI
ncbi:MAG: hypothetical protein QXG00_02315 [Candidatus Woesearchaeota archaeon]